MKRSIDSVENFQSDGQASVKRANTIASQSNEDEELEIKGDFALVHKNKFLWLELSKSKRSLNEARKELEMMRKKTREMESLVSVIQRAWSQLDIDTSLLLDGLADPDVEIPTPNSQLLKDFIHSSDEYLYQDPTNLSMFPQITSDQWSSSEEIQRATELALQSLPNLRPVSDDFEEQSLLPTGCHPPSTRSTSNRVTVFGEQIEDHLVNHISFTFSILERLCYALSDGANLRENIETLKSLQALKESRAKELVLSDGIAKLEAELYKIDCKHRISEIQKLRAEKLLDRASQTIKELEEKLAVKQQVSSSTEIMTGNESKIDDFSVAGGSCSRVVMNLETHELHRQVAMLERQLAESESAKAEAEMHLTERISRPLMQADAQVSDMRKAMEDLRLQCKQRVSHLLSENEALHERVKDLQLALSQIETTSTKRIEEFVFALEKEFGKFKQEKALLEQKLRQLDSTVDFEQQCKALLQEYQHLEDSKSAKILTLENELKACKEINSQFTKNLEKSRKRERYLESVILHFAIPMPSNPKSRTATVPVPPSIASSGTATSSMTPTLAKSEIEFEIAGAESFTDGDGKLRIDLISHQMLKQTQERCMDLEKEAAQVKAQVNDLITEIEAISNHEAAAREQSEGLIKRISESHTMQQAALEENLKLINELDDAKAKKIEAESKCDLMKSVLGERDKLLNQLRAEEFNVMSELNAIKKTLKDQEENKNAEKERNEELQQKLDDLKVKLQDTSKRNQDLQARCNELSKQCQRERKLRLEEQRKDKKTSLKREPSISEETVAATNQHDMDMLEMTLGMLRCSVCKDRFKSATIKKCFHLFCRECIDENIRSRLRKCPACGEKFGQDDIANIYFTN